jgi:transcriptional regulator with XRE-family HTH domain
MITGRQIKAARALLEWDAADLAKEAKLSRETVSNIENNLVQPREGTLADIARAFDSRGIEFIGNQGVQIKQHSVYALEDIEGFKRLMDDVYLAACDPSATDGRKPICICNVDDRLFMKYLGNYMLLHVKRMNDLQNVKVRILVSAEHFYAIPNSPYIEYRWNPQKGAGTVPFYVYGDKLAVLMLDKSRELQIVVIQSALVAKAYREQFEILWPLAETPEEHAKQALRLKK